MWNGRDESRRYAVKAFRAVNSRCEPLNKVAEKKKMRKPWGLFWIGVIVIVAGCWLAHHTQTHGGIRIQDVRFTGANATPMSGLLYVPVNASSKTPAPGILAVHGYINSRETQSAFAIEYARRGYVVLALDQTGHGYSGGAAFSNGFGGPDGLKYLRSLEFVDRDNIGLEGHSMGGWAILAAALALPDGYKSMVLEGSAVGTVFSPTPGDTKFPRNIAVVFSQYDEFSTLMWGVARAKDVGTSAKLKAMFGTDSNVVSEKLYGSLETGNARALYTPATTHPGDHISAAAVGDSLEWFQKTLVGGTPLPRADQIWIWKELGTLIALVGFVVLILGTFAALIDLPYFAALRQAGVPVNERRDARWWLSFFLTAALPVLTYFYFFGLGAKWLPPSRYFPQSITNQVLVWALLNGAITLVLGKLLFKSKATSSRWLLSGQIALATMGVGYAALLLADYFFKVDFRFWVVALRLLSVEQFSHFLAYLLPFGIFFVVAFRALHGFVSIRGEGAMRLYAAGIGAMAFGFLVFIAAQYLPLFTIGHLLSPDQALNTIVSIQFLPLMVILSVISVFTWRRTNSYVPGALISTLFVTWYMVAGTATQFGG
jgi:pimeloyl-ACP methyl ester carboxylesterase